jgi:uncharacterized protein (TIGR02996 family)
MPATDTDESAILRAILAAPLEDTHRLVYADWLDENAGAFACPTCEGGREHPRHFFPRTWDVEPGEHTPCVTCGDVGTVPDGRRERAASIREMVADPGFSIDLGGPGNSLYARDHKTILIGLPPEVHAVVRRGFVEAVRLPSAAFLGGECGQCGRESEEVREQENAWRGPCPSCHGNGRTGGLAKALFRAHPITRVVLTDAVIHPSGGNDTYYLGGLGRFPVTDWRQLQSLPSRAAVLEAVSEVCVKYGRNLAFPTSQG